MNRNDLKEYYQRLKRGQQNSFVGANKLLREGSADRRELDISPDHDQQLSTGMFSNDDSSRYSAVGGGLGRGQSLAEENLKNALADLYQEVIDAEEDEIDPADYSFGSSMDMMGNANFEASKLIRAIVENFLEGKI